jgi:hypothetical protein
MKRQSSAVLISMPSIFKAVELVQVLVTNSDIHAVLVLMGLLLAWLWCTKEDELPLVKGFLQHISVWTNSLVYMVLSKDTKGLGPKYRIVGAADDPARVAKRLDETTTKRIIFIRHGESDWNNVFNKGKNIGMLFRLLKAIITEWTMIFRLDSPFLDSPLNEEGIEQALQLREYIENDNSGTTDSEKELLDVMRGKTGTSIIVSSILRRAIATTTLAVWPRIERTGEKIHLLSHLQEISRNVDTCALSQANTVADLPFSRVSPHCGGSDTCNSGSFNTSLNHGSKALGVKGKGRIEDFNKWAMECTEDTIIVGGHSLWFKQYFNLYLPFDSSHRAKDEKLTNSGVVAFTLHKVKGEKAFYVDPASLQTVYGGYTKK